MYFFPVLSHLVQHYYSSLLSLSSFSATLLKGNEEFVRFQVSCYSINLKTRYDAVDNLADVATILRTLILSYSTLVSTL